MKEVLTLGLIAYIVYDLYKIWKIKRITYTVKEEFPSAPLKEKRKTVKEIMEEQNAELRRLGILPKEE